MKPDEDYLRKIVLLLNEPDNVELLHEVEALRTLSPDHDTFYKEVVNLWAASADVKDLQHINVAEATERLSLKLKQSPRYVAAQRGGIGVTLKWFMRAAAVLVTGAVGYWMYMSRQVEFITKSTGPNVRDTLVLADRSQIFMDENTTVRYPSQWSGSQRRVYLETGNAFFSVSHDKEHPFVVQMQQSTVTVLGTTFNIRLRQNEIAVSVKTGTVMFEPGGTKENPVLRAGDGIVFNTLARTLTTVDVTNENSDAWLTHELVFTDASLREVLSTLEEYYHVRFVVVDSITKFKKFNATFKNNSLKEVLDVLAAAYPVKIETKDSLVVIQGNP
ncbi:FecR family protein [Chryseolinea serpens]|uniref:FecR family protein n=1 Tax=Chryseolinea serpens TaxID=947013 RepID=A0A1M5QUB5_9BACT|nr:FecR domain-containing protein [Chryseolinea serpens]SHH17695.1 FecR family protein [Chryseolinea serpens]